ncbi:DNA polymerase III subunit gamma/tau, partial [Thermodesulfatator atlanticus]
IDEIRELRENVKFPPSRLRTKVYIIDEAHMLTREAFNALLKTLEEPPPHVKFVLATTEPHKIPVTILSRCQRYDFRRLSFAKLVSFLAQVCDKENVSIEENALEIIAREAEGSVRDALSLLDQAISSGVRTAEDARELFGLADNFLLEQLARAIIARDLASCFSLVNQAYEQGLDLTFLAQDLVEFFRNLLALRSSSGRVVLDIPESELSLLRELSLEVEPQELLILFQTLLAGFEALRRSPVPKLSLELMLAKACEIGQVVALDKLFEKIAEIKAFVPSSEISSEKAEPSAQKTKAQDVSWEEFVTKLKEEKPTLGALFETLSPPSQDGNKLVLVAPEHPLLEDKDALLRVKELAFELLKRPLEIQVHHEEESSSKRQKLVEKPIVQDTLKIFGGRIAKVKIYEKE